MLTNVALWQLIVIFMSFTTCCNLVLSANIFKKDPYWADYLTDLHNSEFKCYLTSPIEVWPSRLFENYTKLTVSSSCCELT